MSMKTMPMILTYHARSSFSMFIEDASAIYFIQDTFYFLF